MIKYILSDLDGVIRIWDNSELFELERQCGLPHRALFALAFESVLLHQAVTGKITDEAWRREVTSRFGDRYPDLDSGQFMHLWQEASYKVNEAVLQAFRSHFPQAQVLLATNGTTKLDSDLKKMGLSERFASIYNSASMGSAKPEPGYYHHILSNLGAGPSEIIYVDDSQKNIHAGTELGLITHCFEHIPGLHGFLTEVKQLHG